jgi:hypothetical protein
MKPFARVSRVQLADGVQKKDKKSWRDFPRACALTGKGPSWAKNH